MNDPWVGAQHNPRFACVLLFLPLPLLLFLYYTPNSLVSADIFLSDKMKFLFSMILSLLLNALIAILRFLESFFSFYFNCCFLSLGPTGLYLWLVNIATGGVIVGRA